MSARSMTHISAVALACTIAAVFGSIRPTAQQSIVITGVTTQLTSDPAPRGDTSMSGSVVVWTDQRFGNDDIFYRDGLGPEVQLTYSPRPQRLHDVSGRIVVYSDLTPPGPFVRAVDLTTNTEIGVFGSGAANAQNPRTLVVYESGLATTFDVWLADLKHRRLIALQIK